MAKLVKMANGDYVVTITAKEVEAEQTVARNAKGEVLGFRASITGDQIKEEYQTIDDNGKPITAVREFKVGTITLSAKDLGVKKDKAPSVGKRLDDIMTLLQGMNSRLTQVEQRQAEYVELPESQCKTLNPAPKA